MLIRPETEADHAAIAALTARAFAASRFGDNGEAAIIDRLRRAGALRLSLVAVEDGAPVGHVGFSPVTVDGAAVDWLALAPLSILPAAQGLGLGAGLVRAGLARLAARGGIVLLGDPGYYARFGFVADPGLRVPGVAAEHVLSLPLSGAAPRGVIGFHPAFDSP